MNRPCLELLGYTFTESKHTARPSWQVRCPKGERIEDCADSELDAVAAANYHYAHGWKPYQLKGE